MPRSPHHHTYTYNDNFRSPPPHHHYAHYSQHNPDVSPRLLTALILAALLLVYHALHGLLRWPPPLQLLYLLVGSALGPAAREMLQAALAARGYGYGYGYGVADGAGGDGGAGGVGAGAGGGAGAYVGGLWNMGNTCYQNSVLQAMASLSHLKPHLLSLSTSTDIDDHHPSAPLHPSPSSALSTLLTALNTRTPRPRATAPPPLLVRGTTDAGTTGWPHNEQQDAQEYFQRLTGALEKEAGRLVTQRKRRAAQGLEAAIAVAAAAAAAGPVVARGEMRRSGVEVASLERQCRSPFEGLFAQRVGCLRCGYVEAISMQRFTSLSLPLPPTWTCTLEDCLEEFTALEQITHVDCDNCTLLAQHPTATTSPPNTNTTTTATTGPKVASTKTKQAMIARAPPVLVLHLNRSRYDVVTGLAGKNHAAVSFPARMDLGRLGVVAGGQWGLGVEPARSMSCVSLRGEKEMDGEKEKEMEVEGEKEKEMEMEGQGEREKKKEEEKEDGEQLGYELKSVVAHYGGHHNGHYVCYRKQRGQWFKISDHDVYACDEEQALGVSNAFMLFYERVVDGSGDGGGVGDGRRRLGGVDKSKEEEEAEEGEEGEGEEGEGEEGEGEEGEGEEGEGGEMKIDGDGDGGDGGDGRDGSEMEDEVDVVEMVECEEAETGGEGTLRERRVWEGAR